MPQEFTMPKLGLTMTDGTIREWLVAAGTHVNVGDPVLIIETDKVETEVEARAAGIFQPAAEVGDNFECGAVIGWLLEEGEGDAPVADARPPDSPDRATASAPAAPVAATAAAPAAGAGVANGAGALDVAARGERGRILASPRARRAARERDVDLAHISGTGPNGRIVFDDVAGFAPPAAPPPAEPAVAVQQTLISPAAAPAPAPTPSPTVDAAAPSAPSTSPSGGAAGAAPSVPATGGARMLAELLGVDLALVPAAAGMRVTREDVAAWVRVQLGATGSSLAAAPAPTPAAPGPAPSTVMPLLQEPSATTPLRGMRGVIAERMHTSLGQMAQLTLSVDADMDAVAAERNRLKANEEGVPGYTAWVVAAAGRALVDHPYVNSQITGDGVALLPEIHIGVAVALDDGLIVPVVRNADTTGVDAIHSSVADLARRARAGKLGFDDLEGGTFSVTALGMYGVDMFTPIINPPNTAILGVGRLRTETAWSNGQPIPKQVLTLSLTWDHRAFDGAPAADFAQSLVRYLEDPEQLR